MSVAAPPDTGRVLAALRALADPTRLLLLQALAGGERCVCDLHRPLGLAQNLASHHLRVLREAGLVHARRDSRWAYYSLDRDALARAWGDLEGLLADGPPLPASRCA